MAIEYGAVGALKILIEAAKSGYAWFRGRRASLSNVEILQQRSKWKPIIDEHIARCRRDGLGQDVNVRDIDQLDDFPGDEKKDDTTWFRAGLVGANERSILLLLKWVSLDARVLTSMPLDTMARENAEGSEAVALIGYVPFEQIVDVNWQGDDYTNHPSLFLHFDASRHSPCSRLALSRRKTMDFPGGQDFEWYSEICDLNAYRAACTKLGISPDLC